MEIETNLIWIDVILMIFPLIYVIIYDSISLKEKKSIYMLLKISLIICGVFFGGQVILGVYFKLFHNLLVCYIAMICLFTVAFFLFKMEYQEIERKFYMLFLVLYLITLLFMVYSIFFTPLKTQSNTETLRTSNSGYILIALIIAISVPLVILQFTHRYLIKQSFDGISEKELKTITYYFTFALIFFFIIGLVSFLFTYNATVMFSGESMFDEDVGDKISSIFNSVLNDPLFVFTSVFTMFGALARVLGNKAYAMMGNLTMAFLPMLLWLMTWFGDTPKDIVDLFLGFEIFAKVFHILIVTMMISILLSAWRLFTSIVALK